MLIDFNNNKHDKVVQAMTKKGFTTKFIAHHTGLSECQGAFRRVRIKEQTGFSVIDYRNGRNTEGQELINRIDKMLGWIKSMRISPMQHRQRHL